MNVEIGNIGTEAAHFPEKEYINGIFIAVFTLYSRVQWFSQLDEIHQQKDAK
jgi:hypothetical protein